MFFFRIVKLVFYFCLCVSNVVTKVLNFKKLLKTITLTLIFLKENNKILPSFVVLSGSLRAGGDKKVKITVVEGLVFFYVLNILLL